MTSKPNKDDPVAQLMRLVDSYKDAQAQNKYGNLPKIREQIEEAALGLQVTPPDAIKKDRAQRVKVAKALGLDSCTNWAWSYLRERISTLAAAAQPVTDLQTPNRLTERAVNGISGEGQGAAIADMLTRCHPTQQLGEHVATLWVEESGVLDFEVIPPCRLPAGEYPLHIAARAKQGSV